MILNIVAVALLAGIASGAFYGFMNILFVTPYIDRAVEIEASRLGLSVDIAYRGWQKQGAILAGLLAGVAYSSLFSAVYSYIASRKALTVGGGVALALLIWIVLYLMPAIKYPANPPAVGDPDTIYYRQSIYIAYMLISGISALALALLRIRIMIRMKAGMSKNVSIVAAYASIMVVAYILMPPTPDTVDMTDDILTGFRVASAFTSLSLWLMIGLTTSLLWSRTGLIKRRIHML
ncbi:MAG: CbtA family protein [Candidatus Nitrosocaldus sp.]